MNKLLLPLLLLLLSTTFSANALQAINVSEKEKKEKNAKKRENLKEKTALNHLNESSKKKRAKGCIKQGYLLIKEGHYTSAMKLFKEAFFLGDEDAGLRGKFYIKCLEKDPEGCYLLGYMAENGKGGEQNSTLATQAYALNLEK